MSIQDDINALRRIVERIPLEQLRFMQEQLMELNSDVRALLGEDHGFYHGIGAVAAEVGTGFELLIGTCREYESAILDAADRLEQGG